MTAAPSAPAETARIHFLDLHGLHAPIRAELEAVFASVMDSNGFVGGSLVERFQAEFAAYCDTKHSVGVANGTDALELALRALGVGRGDEVVVPGNTFIATAEAVVAAGATPRFVDVDPSTLLLTPSQVEAALGPRTAAVIPVHLYGQMCDMPAIQRVASRAQIAVVEDAAQAHGATFEGRRAGSFGDAGCFSFYPGKNLGALGDGGAITTNDDALQRQMDCLANHGRGNDRYDHVAIGRNSRLDGLQAGFLSVKLAHLDRWNAKRRDAAARYRVLLAAAGIRTPTEDPRSVGAFHLMVAIVEGRDRLMGLLADQGIGAGIHYPKPCHLQEPYSHFPADELPVVESTASQLLSLPMHPLLAPADIERVVAALQTGVDQ